MKKIIISILFFLPVNNSYPMKLVEQFFEPKNFDEEGHFRPMSILPNEVKNIIIQDIINCNSLFAWLAKNNRPKYVKILDNTGDLHLAKFTEGGSKVLIDGSNKAILLNVKSRSILNFFKHKKLFISIISKDGSKVLTTSLDRTAKLWDVDTGRCLQVFRQSYYDYYDFIMSAVFSRDGSKVITASYNSIIRLWDVKTGSFLQLFKHDDHSIGPAILGKDGNKILTTSNDNTVRLWDVHSGNCLQLFRHDYPIRSVKFSKDESKVLACGGKTAILWDVDTGRCLQVFRHEYNIYRAIFNEDESKVLTTSIINFDLLRYVDAENYIVTLWDVNTGSSLKLFKHQGLVESGQLSKDGSKVLTNLYGRKVGICEVNTGNCLQLLRHDGRVESEIFNKDGNKVLTVANNKVKLWNISSIKNVEESLKQLPFEQLMLIFFIYETQLINRVNKHRKNGLRSIYFPIYKYQHLQKIYKSLDHDIRVVLDKYFIKYS